MENRVKECQVGQFAGRTNCHLWWPSRCRLLLASLSYALAERLRTTGLAGTEFARLQNRPLRARLLKIGTVIVRSTRRMRFDLARAAAYPNHFTLVASRFATDWSQPGAPPER
jgi:hypothetical protein